MTPIAAMILGVALGGCVVLVGQLVIVLLGGTILDRAVAQVEQIVALRERSDGLIYEDEEPAPDATIDAEVVEERQAVRLPLDPDNPPTWRTARVDRPDVLCNCHGFPVKAGERLLFWPMGDGVMRVYHEDATEAEGR